MEIIEILGYVAAILIGVSLGLIGGGGSILTVPVLVYLLGVEAVTSTSYSLFIVGGTALIGAIRAYMRQMIEVKTGIIFAIPSLVAVWLTRAILIPAIPDVLWETSSFVLSKDLAVMLFFAIIMLFSSYSMIRSKKDLAEEAREAKMTLKDDLLIVAEGLAVGTATGIVGAGGGFLIIPALVLLAKIPMKKAVGTSLMIIAMKSLIGFTGDLLNPDIEMQWGLLLVFTALSIIGIFIGAALSKKISGLQLKKGFGWFLLIMGVYILLERLMSMTM